jgi:membrane protease YdiL (CAAX protease family)
VDLGPNILFDIAVRNIPHPAVIEQVSAPQPLLATVLVGFAVSDYLPGLLANGLMSWRPFWLFTAKHNDGFYIALLFTQLFLGLGVVALFSTRYSSAIWTRKGLAWPQLLVALAVFLPLLLFYAFHCFSQIQCALSYSPRSGRAEDLRMLASIYQYYWDETAAGTSPVAIACASVRTLALPLVEEVLLTGFLTNAIARRYGFAAAAVGVPLCFTLGHVPRFGIHMSLVPLFFASVTYVTVRFCSGLLSLAVLSHCVINAVVFLPKWVVAALYFGRA